MKGEGVKGVLYINSRASRQGASGGQPIVETV